MASVQNIKKQLLPLIKGLPIIIIVFVIAIFIAKKIIQYTPTMYLSVAKIKLDNQKYGFSNNLLYEDFDVFSAEEKIETEAEILGSHLLIKKALEKVDFNISINRIGKLKNAKLYNDSPFRISHQFIDENLYDTPFNISIINQQITLINGITEEVITNNGAFNKTINIKGNEITILRNDSLIELKKLDVNGNYSFTIYSEQGLIDKIKKQLDVQAIDKEMSVLRVVFKDEIPERTSDFNNALCEAYIEDYVSMKSFAANKTVEFIDEKLSEVGKSLATAEHQLEKYKLTKNVVNTLQETETGLRQISNLKIQLINTEMNEKAILELEEYIKTGDFFDETAINFGFGDLLMTELVKKLKLWTDEKQDLLIKYKENSDQIIAVNNKIEEVKRYIKEAIKSNKKEIITKKEKLNAELEILSHQFDDIPTREKDLQILDREFRLQESIYNFLSQKRIEAYIVSTSSTSFHRIIEPAYTPKTPTSPNKTLITFVAGLLGLIIGITLVYLRQFARGKVMDKSDLERNSMIPIAGIIRHFKKEKLHDFHPLVKTLLLKENIKPKQIIAITSTLCKEGKTLVAENIAKTLMQMNYKVCLVDYDIYNQQLSGTASKDLLDVNELDNGITLSVTKSLSKLKTHPLLLSQKLNELKQSFDFVVVDTSATAMSIEPVEIMKIADLTLFVLRANFTALSYVNNIDLLKEEFHLSNIQLVLTDAHKASNYNGNLVGTRFNYSRNKKGLINRVKRYIKYYLK